MLRGFCYLGFAWAANAATGYHRTYSESVLGRAPAGAPVWGYRFDHVPSFEAWTTLPPECQLGATPPYVCHTFELPFVFHNATTVADLVAPVPPQRFTLEEADLSARVQGWWTTFPKSKKPAAAKVWPRFAGEQGLRLVIDEATSTTNDADANCDLWDSIGYGADFF